MAQCVRTWVNAYQLIEEIEPMSYTQALNIIKQIRKGMQKEGKFVLGGKSLTAPRERINELLGKR